MNIPYLLKTLKTDKLSELVANIDLPILDMNLAMWDSIDRGEIIVDEDNDSVKLREGIVVTPSSDPSLANKLIRVIQHYAKEETNINRGRLNSYIKDPITGQGYGWHEYIMALQQLIDDGQVIEDVIEVPAHKEWKIGKKGKKKEVELRPAHKFVFLCLPENADKNAEWNAKAINKWIEDFEKA